MGSTLTIPINHKDPFSFATAKLLEKSDNLPNRDTTFYVSNPSKIPRSKVGQKGSATYSIVFIQEQLAQMNDWTWKLFEFSDACPGGKSLYILTWHLYDIYGLFDEFKIPMEKFNNFFWNIQEGYRDLPCTS